MSSIQKIHLSVPEEELDALKRRLNNTRWPDAETVTDWSQGVPITRMRALIEHWAGAVQRLRQTGAAGGAEGLYGEHRLGVGEPGR